MEPSKPSPLPHTLSGAVSPSAPLQVARLYVVSDILHNSSAPVRNASAYRTRLEAALPAVFESLRASLRAEGVGRMAAEQLKRRVQARCRRDPYPIQIPIDF